MNWTDGVILGVLALSVLVGLFRGLVAEVLSLIIWVAAFAAAWMFGPVLSAQLTHTISMPSLRYSVGYGACFVIVLIIGALVRFMVRRLIWGAGLSGIDRLLGMVFGFVRGVLIVTLLVFLVGMTPFTREVWWQQSALTPQFQSAAAWLGQNIPPGVRSYLHPSEMLDRLPELPSSLHGPASGAAPAKAASTQTQPSSVFGQLHTTEVLDQLRSLPAALHAPTLSTTPAPATSARQAPPAATSSTPTPSRIY